MATQPRQRPDSKGAPSTPFLAAESRVFHMNHPQTGHGSFGGKDRLLPEAWPRDPHLRFPSLTC